MVDTFFTKKLFFDLWILKNNPIVTKNVTTQILQSLYNFISTLDWLIEVNVESHIELITRPMLEEMVEEIQYLGVHFCECSIIFNIKFQILYHKYLIFFLCFCNCIYSLTKWIFCDFFPLEFVAKSALFSHGKIIKQQKWYKL